jgi:hypothetical protein
MGIYVVSRVKPNESLAENEYYREIVAHCKALQEVCKQVKRKPALQLPDVDFETRLPLLFDTFPKIQFFGFTSDYARMERYCCYQFPFNYHLTFNSRKEEECKKILEQTGNIAWRFNSTIPTKLWGYQVHKAINPLRFLDNFGVIALSRR